MDHQQAEILELRAKLQAAEALNEEYRIQLLMADKISGDQRSRAEAAEGALVAEQEHVEILESEVARLTKRVEELEHIESLYRSDLSMLDFLRTNNVPVEFLGNPIVAYAAHLIVESRARIAELEAREWDLSEKADSRQSRIAELEADREVAERDARSTHLDAYKRATESALRWAWELPWPTDGLTEEKFLSMGINALLGEGG